jgi:UDP-N-acetylglucosamine 3-dehydrogenase
MNKIKAAVVGVGAMGRNHARVYHELVMAELVAVTDANEECAEQAGRMYGATAYTDYQKMLAHERPDVVSVAVPTQLHCEVALAALDAGCHVLVEKPLAWTLDEGRRIIDRARDKGLKLTAGHIERFNPAIIELRRRISEGELGRAFHIHAQRLGPFPARVRDVGVVVDLATHDLDIMRYLIGSEVMRVSAETERNIHTTNEDLLSALLKFENGVIGLLNINWLTPTKVRELSVTGERGMFVVKYLTQDLFFYENDYANGQWHSMDILRGVSVGNRIQFKIQKCEPLRAELESFIAAVANDRQPLVSGEDGLAALALALKVVESGRSHQLVS